MEKTTTKKSGELVSRLPHEVFIKVGKETIRLSPREKAFISDASELQSTLPNGVVFNEKK